MTYVAETGRTDVQDGVNRLGDDGIAKFERAVAYLAVTPIADWKKPHALKLKGVKDLHEIRFKAQDKQFRALGFFGPVDGYFTITLLCTHKDDVYKPHDAIKTAGARADAIKEGRATATALTIDGEDFSKDDESS